MSKHTPGPWSVSQTVGTVEIRASRGEFIASLDVITPISLAYIEANAKLIAAAPDLAEALAAVAEFWAGGDAPSELTAQIERALAKAGL